MTPMPKKKVAAKKAEPKVRTDKAWMYTQKATNTEFKKDGGATVLAYISSVGDLDLSGDYTLTRNEALRLAAWIKEWFE